MLFIGDLIKKTIMMLGLAFLCLLNLLALSNATTSNEEKRETSLNEAKQAQPMYVLEDLRKPSLQATDPVDREVLVQLYHFTSGSTWLQNSGWLSGDPCQSLWYGIICSESGNVLEITLANNQLAGELPPRISELKYIQVLRLYNNIIGGNLLQSLFTIPTLKILDLDNNILTGSLPSNLAMPLIKNLSIANNQIAGFLPYYWNSPNLESVSLQSNQLQGPIPEAISTATTLKYLDISSNFLSGPLPPEMGRLKSLETLWMSQNFAFAGAEIPDGWRGLTAMRDFRANSLGGKLPELIGMWSNLEYLDISNGAMTGPIPESFCQLQQLQSLKLASQSITGEFPTCFCYLSATRLTSIDLTYNHISGKLPNCFQNLHNLTSLSLADNNISGTIPPSLGTCKTLATIDLSYNRMTGSIPYTFANLVNIKELYLQGNKFNTVDNGLESFFRMASKSFYCSLYSNPWSCPLPSYFSEIKCAAQCSKCNPMEMHNSCRACVGASECGWCREGPNCLEGGSGGPSEDYRCEPSNWIYGYEAECKN